jgi:nitroreductase
MGTTEGTDNLWEAMSTQRAIRYFKPDPISDEVLWKVLDHTLCAPNGQNRQGWAFLVVREAGLRKRIAEQVALKIGQEPAFKHRVESGMQSSDRSRRLMMAGGKHIADHLDDAPVFVIPCAMGPYPDGIDRLLIGSSIYPAVQNLMLAARGAGLGTVITGFHGAIAAELREWLEIPEQAIPVALIPMGYPDAKFGPVVREPAEESTHWDRWGARGPKR